MVEYLEHGLQYHVAQELQQQDDDGGDDASSIAVRLERSFLMADIHSRQLGVSQSGATVACCLVTTTINDADNNKNDNNTTKTVTIHTANAGDARIVLGHSNGKATRMTKDHRTDDDEEINRIEKAGGFMFKGRVLGVLAVTRSLGDHVMKDFVIAKPYINEVTIQVPVGGGGGGGTPPFLILAW